MIFHVDLNAFFASIEQRDNPKLRGKPVIVGGPAKHRGVVAAASYEARKYGIHSAMPLSIAFRLCPHVILVSPNFPNYTKESKAFYEVLYSFSPFIEQVSIDEAYISFYGFEAYYGDFTALAKKIKQAIVKRLGITSSVGIAANKTVAKVASSRHKPDGLTVVAKGKEKAFLTDLPLQELPGLGEKTEERLKRLGIKTLGELANTSRTKLATLFGKHGEYLWEASNGEGDEMVETNWQRKSIGTETTLLFDSNNKNFLEQTLYFLTLRAVSDLRSEGKKARGISLKIRSSSFQTKTHQAKLFFLTDNTKELYESAKKLLYEAWNGQSMLRLIGVSFFNLTTQAGQSSLFEPLSKKTHAVETTLDKLREKHGFWSIYPASLLSKKATLKKHAKVHSSQV